MRKVKIMLVVVLLLLGVTGAVVSNTSLLTLNDCSKYALSRGEAEKIATEKLAEYCEREGLSLSRFPAPQVSSAKDVPWIFDYTSDTSPRHFVRIHIDECGVVELSREIYSR